MFFSVEYLEKDIQDIQDIKKKTGNTKRLVAYLPQEILFYRNYISRKKVHGKKTFKNVLFSNCDL